MAKSVQDWTTRYSRPKSEPTNRLFGMSTGEVGSGKSSFWFGAPGPLVIFDTDSGTEGVVEPYMAEKDIFIVPIEWYPTDTMPQDDVIDLRDKFIEDFEHAITHARSVLIDKESHLWEIFRYAEFGGPSDSPRNYAALNQRYRKYLSMPNSLPINFGLIQAMKNEWITVRTPKGEKGAESGNRIARGFTELDELVHLTLHHKRTNGVLSYTVGKSRGPGGKDVQDQTFDIDADYQLDGFRNLAMMVYPGTEESDWR